MKRKFINSIKDGAIESQRKHNILASLTLAQAIVESGWGRQSIGNNIFGIKVGSNWTGKKQLVTTREFILNQKMIVRDIIQILAYKDAFTNYRGGLLEWKKEAKLGIV